MPYVAVIVQAQAFCYQRDMPNIERSSFTGTRRMRIADPYGAMMSGVESGHDYVEPAPRKRAIDYDFDAPYDRHSRGKAITLRSLRNPVAFGGDNPKAAIKKISLRIA